MPSPHILIVDDDTITASVLKEHLESKDFDVSMVEDSQLATQALENPRKIDLIILDYLLPDGNGTEFLKAIAERKNIQKPPVVMASSIVDPKNTNWQALFHHLPSAARKLIYAFVTKPYSFDNLDIVLSDTLRIKAVQTKPPQALMGDYQPNPHPYPPKEAA